MGFLRTRILGGGMGRRPPHYAGDFLLLEDGSSFLLLETGDKLILEG